MSLIPFAYSIDKEELVDVSEVSSGLKCNCICPSCEMMLKARKGEHNEHHFAHHKEADTKCEYSYWVSVRDMATQIIKKSSYINIHLYNLENLHKKIFITEDRKVEIFKVKKYMTGEFDLLLDTSIGKVYLYFKTLEDNFLIRDKEHESRRDEYFSSKLILSINLSKFISNKNNFKNNLKDVIINSTLEKRMLKPINSFFEYVTHAEYELIEPNVSTELNNDIPLYKLPYVKDKNTLSLLNLQNKVLSKEDIRTINTMKNFYEYHIQAYIDSITNENFSILYTGKNLTLICYKNSIYGLAFILKTSYVYTVYNDEIIYMDKGKCVDDLICKIDRYMHEWKNSF